LLFPSGTANVDIVMRPAELFLRDMDHEMYVQYYSNLRDQPQVQGRALAKLPELKLPMVDESKCEYLLTDFFVFTNPSKPSP
jgi:hypothetical protein